MTIFAGWWRLVCPAATQASRPVPAGDQRVHRGDRRSSARRNRHRRPSRRGGYRPTFDDHLVVGFLTLATMCAYSVWGCGVPAESKIAPNSPGMNLGEIMPENRTIFHYCGTEAFLGIMNGLKLRLGPVEFMNDSTEFVWGRNLVQAKLNQYAGLVAWSAASNVIRKAIAIFPSQVSSPFLCCFSQDGDLLSQWRAYAQNGRGFAIGVRDSQLGVARISPLTSSNPDETIGLVDVIYDRNTQIAAIESAIGYNLTNWNNRAAAPVFWTVG
jgi:Protein of unknown function (DUF2971)